MVVVDDDMEDVHWRTFRQVEREKAMWKSFFLAIGATLCIVGMECLLIERATLTDEAVKTRNVSAAGTASVDVPGAKDVVPPEWAPWSLMSTGMVVILYSFSIPQRVTT